MPRANAVVPNAGDEEDDSAGDEAVPDFFFLAFFDARLAFGVFLAGSATEKVTRPGGSALTPCNITYGRVRTCDQTEDTMK